MSFAPQQPPFDPSKTPYTPGGAPPSSGPSGLAIAAVVCGGLSLPISCCCSFFSLPLSIAAFITGGMVLMKPNASGRGLAIAGLVCAGLSILWVIFALILTFTNPEIMRQLQQNFQR